MAEGRNSHSNTLEFFVEVGKLKFLKRTGWMMRHIENCESVAGHMYRMGVMAFLLDDEVLNKDRCIKMALVHDMPECIVGDLTPFCGVSKEEKHKQEMEAMNKLCSLVGKEIGKELLSLFMEYEEQKTTEARSVKDLDKFDMLLQAYEYESNASFALNLQDFFDNTKGIQNKTVLNWFQDLQCLRSKNPDGPLSSEPKKPKSSVFELFLLIGKLKHMKLACWNHDEPSETVADHIYRSSIMAFLLGDSTSSGLNRDKCIKMALIQNMIKSTNNNSPTHILSKEENDRADMQVMQGICDCLDERVNKEFLDLFKEYQAQHTLEAKLVKDLDEFEYLLQFYENEAKAGTKHHFLSTSNHSFQNSEVSKWVKELQILGNET